jgi:hypothetical protein
MLLHHDVYSPGPASRDAKPWWHGVRKAHWTGQPKNRATTCGLLQGDQYALCCWKTVATVAEGMSPFWQRATGAFLFLLAVLGGAAAAQQFGLAWIVVALAVAAVLIAATPPIARRAARGARSIVEYPQLVKDLELARSDLNASERRLMRTTKMLHSVHAQGYDDGVSAVRGHLLGWFLKEMPRIVSTSGGRDGRLVLIAEGGKDDTGGHPSMSTRLALQVIATGEIKGVVEIIDVDPQGRSTLVCAEERDPAYWSALTNRPADRLNPPEGVHLVKLEAIPPYPGYDPSRWQEAIGDEN